MATVHVEPAYSRRAMDMFRALEHRNFRLFWAGAFLSNTGTWMQMVAQSWLVLELTDSAFWLGFDAFIGLAPGLLLTLVGGVFADLVDRKKLLIYTQVGAGLSALVLAVLVATSTVAVWMILVLSFATGCCMALAGPSYQAITKDLVGREDLANAIALNSTQFQLSRVIGPVFAGATMHALGLAGCFFLNAASFVFVIGALLLVRFDTTEAQETAVRSLKDKSALWGDLLDGLRYAAQRPRVRTLLIISSLTSLFGAPYIALMPVFARDVYGFGESGYAMMMGVAGVGAFFGALLLTFLGDFRRKGAIVLVGALAFGLSIVGFSLAAHSALALALLFGVGFAMTTCVALVNTLLQQLVTDEMRGRVMSMFILSFVGTAPFGNLIAGAMARRFGAPSTLAACGAVIALFTLIVGLRNRRLWQEVG
ncbi:MAG: MFS transporter [Pyrinomonadaceae bacterium]|nr:MFS transporter [Pyrinomonadaceae bacterium]